MTNDPQTTPEADGQGEPAELRTLPREVRRLVHAVDRMRSDWAEAPEHGPERRELWTAVHEACDAVWNRPDAASVPSTPTQTADTGRRNRYAAPLYTLMRQNGWDGEYTEPVVREMDLVLAAVLAVADAEQAELRTRIAELESSCRDVDRLRRDWVEMRDRAEALDVRVQVMATAVPPVPTIRAAVLREAAEMVRCMAPEHPTNASWVQDCHHIADRIDEAAAVPAAVEEQPDTGTPCGPVPEACDAEAGEPCANHEREQAHAEGEHCFCGPECDTDDAPPAPLRRSSDDCPGFPERCPNLRPVDPNPPTHFGGIRCGCADEPAAVAQPGKEG